MEAKLHALQSHVFEGIKSRRIQTSQFVQTSPNGGKMNNTASGFGPYRDQRMGMGGWVQLWEEGS